MARVAPGLLMARANLSQILESLTRLLAGTAFSYGTTMYLRRRYLDTGLVLGQPFSSPGRWRS